LELLVEDCVGAFGAGDGDVPAAATAAAAAGPVAGAGGQYEKLWRKSLECLQRRKMLLGGRDAGGQRSCCGF
jgi:hypothetical protein